MLAFVDGLQRAASDSVAFYPRSALAQALARDEIRIAWENGEPCGYLWAGPIRPGRDAVIYQAVIAYDLRRRLHGARAVAELIQAARGGGATGVRLRCRSDQEANAFWSALGFSCTAVVPGGRRRSAAINVWRLPLVPGLWDGLTERPSSQPAARRHDLLIPHGSRWARS